MRRLPRTRPRTATAADRPNRAFASNRSQIAFVVVVAAVSAWSLRFLLGGEIPPGNDITGHLQRVDFGIDLLRRGQADGWFPQSMLGYQLYLFYGPGLTLLVGAVRVASLGSMSNAGALEVVLVASLVAVPFTVTRLAKAFRLSTSAARTAGALSLAVGSTRGGGIDGAFNTGLAAQQVAIPLVVLALAQIVERVRRDDAPPPGAVPLAVTVVAMAFTHPMSLVLLAILAPLVLGALALHADIDRRGLRVVATAAGWSIVLSAGWWLPALAGRSLRGPVTSFTLPGVGEHLLALAEGTRGWRGISGNVAVISLLYGLIDASVREDRRRLGLFVLPFAALGSLHLVHGMSGIHHDLGRQIPNRGLVFVALLAALPAGHGLDALCRAITTLARRPRLVLAWPVAIIVAVVSLGSFTPGNADHQTPTPALRAASEILRDEVPDGATFTVIGGGSVGGVPEYARWLAWDSGARSLSLFGPEYAAGAQAVAVATRPPEDGQVDGWLDQVQALAVSHIVSADIEVTGRLRGHPRLTQRMSDDGIFVWAIRESEGHPVGSIVPAEAADVLVATPEHVRVSVESATARHAVMAVGYSPGWHARLDGVPVAIARSGDDRLQIELPVGRHVVDVRYEEPVTGPVGRGITALGLVAIVLQRRRRRTRNDPVAPIGSKSMATARR